jgi:hypothetical protein
MQRTWHMLHAGVTHGVVELRSRRTGTGKLSFAAMSPARVIA